MLVFSIAASLIFLMWVSFPVLLMQISGRATERAHETITLG
jgi:hypothetical protein